MHALRDAILDRLELACGWNRPANGLGRSGDGLLTLGVHMPSWLILSLFIFGCTLVVPVFVWGNSGSFKRAVEAWWFFARYLLALAALAIVAHLIYLLSR
jgi:hypothetical protein